MNKHKMKEIALYVVVFVFVSVSVFVASGTLQASNPTNIGVTLLSTRLLTNANGAQNSVFSDSTGKEVDIITEANGVFGQGTIPVGTYKRVIFTVKNGVSYTGPNPCGGTTYSGIQKIDSTKADSDTVDLYFATGDDGGSSGWTSNGTAAYPFLLQNPIEVKANTNTVIKLVFNTANTMQCNSGTSVQLLPWTITATNWVDQPMISSCSSGGTYWLVQYSSSTHIYDENGSIIQNPSLDYVLRNSEVAAGWGTIKFNSPDANGNGTWIIDLNKTFANGGHAWRQESLMYLADGFYSDPSDPSGGSATGKYLLTGQKMLLIDPDGNIIEGAVTDDCSTIILVQMSRKGENELLYAIKKPASQPVFPGSQNYLFSDRSFETRYDDAGNVSRIGSGFNLNIINGADSTLLNWYAFADSPVNIVDGQATGITSWGASENASIESFAGFNVGVDGVVEIDDGFFVVGATGNGLYAGSTVRPEPNGSYRVGAGILMNLATSPQQSDVAGSWYGGVMNTELLPGSSGWGTGDEEMRFGLSSFSLTIDTSGSGYVTMQNKDIFSGSSDYDIQPVTVTAPVMECFKMNTPTTDAACSGGTKVPVFRITDPETGSVYAKFALDKTKKVITLWEQFDKNDTPENSPDCGLNDPARSVCTSTKNFLQGGMGVKIK